MQWTTAEVLAGPNEEVPAWQAGSVPQTPADTCLGPVIQLWFGACNGLFSSSSSPFPNLTFSSFSFFLPFVFPFRLLAPFLFYSSFFITIYLFSSSLCLISPAPSLCTQNTITSDPPMTSPKTFWKKVRRKT